MFQRAMLLLVFAMLLIGSAFAADVQVTESITGTDFWTSDNTYHLNGRIFVDPGAKLYIEAGTVVKGMPGDSTDAAVLVVSRGGQLFAEGTATRPIIFTAESDDVNNPVDIAYDTKGLWGGIIVLGNAPINASGGEDNIEGIPIDERGLYGGDDAADNSGIIRYVSIRHGGISIGEGNEINGLTMGGVGNGTAIEYVEVISNLDDGFEWFGGTVDGKHLIAAFCGDDAFDIDQGLNSKLQFLFALQHPDFGNMCAEHDGASSSNTAALPVTNVQIFNATYLGSGQNSTNGKQEQILKLRENWAGVYKNSIFGDYNGYGVRVDDKYDPDSRDRLEAGELLLANNIWFNCNGYTIADSIGKEGYTAAHLNANANIEQDPMLKGISRVQDNGLDPRPAVDGPAFTTDMADYPMDPFFECVGFKGAFGVTNWAKGWTALDAYGLLSPSLVPTGTMVDVNADIDGQVVWTADNTYKLSGRIFVNPGAELYIEAGTVVKGAPGDSVDASVLVVSKGGKLFAEGAGDRPIIFTAESDDVNNPVDVAYDTKGLWGGIILLGDASINASGGTDNIEGIPIDARGVYGGSNDYDCSGVLRYVSIRHGGISIGEGNEINGLTMGGVGSRTCVEYVEVISNLDDGFEWFGGTVNGDHLVAAFCGDDSYDIDQGVRNNLDYLFAIQHPQFGNMCAEHDGASSSNTAATPVTDANIKYATYLGSGQYSTNGKQEQILKLRENWAGSYTMSIFGDYNGYGVRVDDKYDPDSRDRLEAGELVIADNFWFACADYTLADSVGKEAYTAAHLNANNNTFADPMLRSISRDQSGSLDPRPATDSPAFGKGAFGLTNWAADWSALSSYGVFGANIVSAVANDVVNPVNNYMLSQNYPNPFNPVTTIDYQIEKAGQVKLSVYNELGQQVATLVNDNLSAGSYQINWNAAQMATGVYFYRLETADKVMTRKMMLVK